MTIAALRLGALNMAIANLLGSNLFDMLVLAIDDIAFLKGPLLSHVSPVHAVSAFSAVIMTGIVVVGIALPGQDARLPLRRLDQHLAVPRLSANSYVLYVFGH